MKLLIAIAFIQLLITPARFTEISVARVAEPESLLRTHALIVYVDDMAKALEFYSGKLGFAGEMDIYNSSYRLLKSADGQKLILQRVPKMSVPKRSESHLSFTLQVNDLDQAIARMKSLGVEFGEKEPRKEAVGKAIFIKDPFGRLISLMHQTIVKTESFKEPRIYNYGFLVPDMQVARDFYSNKLGFVVRSEKYLPLDLPLGHHDKSFAFMLHYRPGVTAAQNDSGTFGATTLVFETTDFTPTFEKLTAMGVKILNGGPAKAREQRGMLIQDPFGNVSLIVEVSPSGVTSRNTE